MTAKRIAYHKFADQLSRALPKNIMYEQHRTKNWSCVLKKLGSGIARATFAHPDWPFLVFKYEYKEEARNNRAEWNFYHEIASPNQQQYLTKPLYISPNGAVIVMERIRKHTYANPCPDDMMDAIYKALDSTGAVWDICNDHNVGASGSVSKVFDYADQSTTFYDGSNFAESECDCSFCENDGSSW